VEGVGKHSIQGDVRFAKALAAMGAEITWGEHFIEAKRAGQIKAFDLDLNHIPDAAMTLAVCALFADGRSVLRNIGSWRVKETDRIAAMATELKKLGATVEAGEDWLAVSPLRAAGLSPSLESPLGAPAFTHYLPNVAIDTYDDHRMAMCFSLVALAGVPIIINDPACVRKTFPDYFDALASIAAPVIAIDGPSASGKGTVASLVAEKLGYHYLDSGALYRLTALAAMRAGVALDDEAGVAALAASLPARFAHARVFLHDEDVTDAIRTEEASAGASRVAVLAGVRAALLARQRAWRKFPGLVADGRDMGSVVFPHANTKIFLTASAQARAERRYKQLIEKGLTANMHALLQDLQARDERDAQRSEAPLRQCKDAHWVDTTQMGIAEAVAAVMAVAGEGS
jgi:3-phosphoshikimate 1-carboxyvinyltransferase